jgi:fumarate hydratase, class II
MVCIQVMGYDHAVSIAGARGNFELNVYKPLIIYNILKSMELLTDAMSSVKDYALAGLTPNVKRIDELLHHSLMLVTALVPDLGYDQAAQIAKRAHQEGLTLREAALASGAISAKDFDQAIEKLLTSARQQGEALLNT